MPGQVGRRARPGSTGEGRAYPVGPGLGCPGPTGDVGRWGEGVTAGGAGGGGAGARRCRCRPRLKTGAGRASSTRSSPSSGQGHVLHSPLGPTPRCCPCLLPSPLPLLARSPRLLVTFAVLVRAVRARVRCARVCAGTTWCGWRCCSRAARSRCCPRPARSPSTSPLPNPARHSRTRSQRPALARPHTVTRARPHMPAHCSRAARLGSGLGRGKGFGRYGTSSCSIQVDGRP
jgi:hypothetical protein